MKNNASKIKVLLFAELSEKYGWDEKYLSLDLIEDKKAKSILKYLNINVAHQSIIVAINKEISSLEATVKDNDEVAFMPIFTGG